MAAHARAMLLVRGAAHGPLVESSESLERVLKPTAKLAKRVEKSQLTFADLLRNHPSG